MAVWSAVSVIIASILFIVNKRFRYYSKMFFFCLGNCFSNSVFIPIMLLRPRDCRNSRLPAWATRLVSKCLGLKWRIRGIENIVQNTGCVALLNHQSALDMFVIAELRQLMEKATAIARREVFYLWPYGFAVWLYGTIFIDRSNREKAQSTLKEVAETVRRNNLQVLMFPEGTRHGGEELLPFKKGAFHIAIDSQTPIQPVVVSQYYFLDSKTYRFDTGTSTIEILPPIPTVGLTKTDIDELMEKTHKVMNDAYKKLSQEVTSNFERNSKIDK